MILNSKYTKINNIIILCLLVCIHTKHTNANVVDDTPPTYSWIYPEAYKVHTTDTIRLCVDAIDNDNGSGIEKVIFYVQYWNADGQYTQRSMIEELHQPPFEVIWDCSDIPDQDYGKLRFYCDVYDNEGNVSKIAENAHNGASPYFILDRNKQLNESSITSMKTNNNITIDGRLSEWTTQDSIVFFNNDNSIIVQSMWDEVNIYFGIRVEDKSVISHYDENSSDYETMIWEDIVEVYIDSKHDHKEMRGQDDISYLMAAGGKFYKRIAYIEDDEYLSYIRDDVTGAVFVEGILNDNRNDDSGYNVELAVPWEELEIEPGSQPSIGLELWNNDKDYNQGSYSYSGWTTKSSNLNNTSEWGNLVFVDEKTESFGKYALYIACILTCALAVPVIVFLFRVKTKHDGIGIEKKYIKISKDYINVNYANETLSRDDIANEVGLTPAYFGHVFKQETGKNVKDYLNDIRINKAKDLLVTTDKTIAEIAYETGFSSQSYFGQKFKQREKISPKDYRHKHQNMS